MHKRWTTALALGLMVGGALMVMWTTPALAQESGGDTVKSESPAAPAADTVTKTAPAPAKDTVKSESPAVPATDTVKHTPAPAETTPKVEEPVDPKAPYKSITFAKGQKPRVVVETSMGRMVFELWPDVAPKHVQSFVYLTNQGFFDSVMFHRVEPGFVIQGGGYKASGSVEPGYTLPAEFSDTLKHDDGILSMARTNDPNSASSQFFICLGPAPHLDRNYTIFGRVVEGLDVAHKIEQSPIRALNPDSPKGMQMHGPITPVYMTKVYLEKKP